MISSEVPPTPVTQGLVAGQEPEAAPLIADRSPSSPELNRTVHALRRTRHHGLIQHRRVAPARWPSPLSPSYW